MTRMELSATGDILAQSDMTPFGQLINRKSDADEVPFTGGEQYDTESGLYSYKYRSYNPQLGRWMSPDPSDEEFARVSNPQSLNLYSYVINDPLKYVDQLGLATGGSCSPPLPKPTWIAVTIPGTNYCGPGGKGTPTDRVDDACAAHDLCYDNAGVTYKNNIGLATTTPQQAAEIQTCNNTLCSTLNNMTWPTSAEWGQATIVSTYFNCSGQYSLW